MMEPAALYLRLSQEDGERWGESQSISNQRIFLTQYCQANGFTVAECYIDDGYTGTNFNRPGFQRLLRDIERGKIKTVITKDLSRLGGIILRREDMWNAISRKKGFGILPLTMGWTPAKRRALETI